MWTSLRCMAFCKSSGKARHPNITFCRAVVDISFIYVADVTSWRYVSMTFRLIHLPRRRTVSAATVLEIKNVAPPGLKLARVRGLMPCVPSCGRLSRSRIFFRRFPQRRPRVGPKQLVLVQTSKACGDDLNQIQMLQLSRLLPCRSVSRLWFSNL